MKLVLHTALPHSQYLSSALFRFVVCSVTKPTRAVVYFFNFYVFVYFYLYAE